MFEVVDLMLQPLMLHAIKGRADRRIRPAATTDG
jgi:hypothetical protein